MPYCIYCGVKLDNSIERCPLCTSELEKTDDKTKTAPAYPAEISKIAFIKTQTSEKDMMIIHFTAFFTLLLLLLTSGIDYSINTDLTWSKFSSSAIIFLYSIFVTVVRLKKSPCIFYTLLNLELSIFLLFLDILIPSDSWFIRFGLPSLLSLQVFTLLIYIFYKKIKTSLYRASITVILANLYLLLLDKIVLDTFTWSLICSAVLIPTSIYLLVIRFKLQSCYH